MITHSPKKIITLKSHRVVIGERQNCSAVPLRGVFHDFTYVWRCHSQRELFEELNVCFTGGIQSDSLVFYVNVNF
jgi:hypothetical protein